MSSDSENSIAPFEDVKPKRRSSIFKPDTEISQAHPNNLTTTIFPSNYTQSLLNESMMWKQTYAAIKKDLRSLKKKASENASHPVHLPNLAFFEEYVRRAEEFCCQVNNMTELQQNAVTFQNIKSQELEKEVEIASKMLQESQSKSAL